MAMPPIPGNRLFTPDEINKISAYISSSLLIIPGLMTGLVFGTIALLPTNWVTSLAFASGFINWFLSYKRITRKSSELKLEEKDRILYSIASSFSIFIGAFLGFSFGAIILFKFLPGIWPNLEGFLGLVIGMYLGPKFLGIFSGSKKSNDANHIINTCVQLAISCLIMFYSGLTFFAILQSSPKWISFWGWVVGIGIGFLSGLGIGGLISKSLSDNNIHAKTSLVNVTIPSIIFGSSLGIALTLMLGFGNIYLTIGIGFSCSSLMMSSIYKISKYYEDIVLNNPEGTQNDIYRTYYKNILHNILFITAVWFPVWGIITGGVGTAYLFFNVYTDGLFLALSCAHIAGFVLPFLYIGSCWVSSYLYGPYHSISEPSKSEPSKTEPSKTEPSKTEPSKSEPSESEPSGSVSSEIVPTNSSTSVAFVKADEQTNIVVDHSKNDKEMDAKDIAPSKTENPKTSSPRSPRAA